MKRLIFIFTFLLISCNEKSTKQAMPNPVDLGPDEVGYYMQMIVADHAGPKAQVWLEDKTKPIWFIDVRDAIKFTRTPEEPDNISVIYAHDMAKNPDYRNVSDHWVNLENAVFVIQSQKLGGMGLPEAIPFSDESSALKFIDKYGGELVSSQAQITLDYLNSTTDMSKMKMKTDEMMNHN